MMPPIFVKNIFMKNLLISSLFLILSINLSAQGSPTCFQKYAKVFEVRGANLVKDGVHKDVIISIRKGSFADCFLGKVKVLNGVIVRKSIELSFVDDSFEPLTRSYKSEDPINIVGGISRTLLTNDEELINIMFVSAIKPKKKYAPKGIISPSINPRSLFITSTPRTNPQIPTANATGHAENSKSPISPSFRLTVAQAVATK